MIKVKVTLSGRGGELDCRLVVCPEGTDPYRQEGMITKAVIDIALNCVFSDGDTITIEQL